MPTTSRNGAKAKPARQTNHVQEKPATTPARYLIDDGPSPSSGEVLRELYFSLLRCRSALERANVLASGGAKNDFAPGDDAVVVGTTFGLRRDDKVAASGRDVAGQIAKGTPLPPLLARPGDDSDPATDASSALTPDPFNLGTGMALALKLEKSRNVVMAFCPDEAPTLDLRREALKVAGAQKLPVIYVIKSGATGEVAKSRNGHLEAFSYMTRHYRFPGIVVDGHDVVAVWRVAQECIHRARNGGGPSLIECTMEFRHDPLTHMEHYLKKRNFWAEDWNQQIVAAIAGGSERTVTTA